MPVINFKRSDLCTMLGRDVPAETLVERIPMIGADMHDTEGDTDDMSVEFFPDRPDLYSVEGLARAMRAFLDIEPGMKTYPVADSDIEVIVDDSVKSVRPYFLCGVVRDVEVTDEFLRSLMELQEKLHITIGRKRSKLAIGIHDLSKVVPPFTYRLAEPHSIRFVPLAMDEEMDLAEVLERNEKGREYNRLLEGMDEYPVILDADGRVLSFPPIINGRLTTVTVGRHDLFIDVTGNDRKAVKGALDIVATALAERGGRIETVVMHDSGETFRSPDLSPSVRRISASACDRFLGRDLRPDGIVECLRRMGLDASADGDDVTVTIPSVRLDVMHDVDVYEDVATGYGFDRFGGPYEVSQTPGSLLPETTFSEGVRDVMLGMGFTEVNTLTLSNQRDEFSISGLPEVDVVRILNPITEDHTCLRAYLAPSLVRILRHNKHRDLPQRIFETGYVVRDARTALHLCAMATASKVPFTEVKSWTEAFLRETGIEYGLEPCDYPTFVPGRGALVVSGGETIGMFGEMAPSVVVDYGITHPIGFFELDLEPMIANKKDTLFRGGRMEVGDEFPHFRLRDENGEELDSSSLEGVRYVIYFYPKDNTPGCTKEAEEFTADVGKFMMRNIPVIGVSRDSPESHRNFIAKHNLKVKLLSDPDHKLTEAVGAWGVKKSYGKETVGVIRSTFIVGKDGRVEAAWRNVRVAGHADKVLTCAVSLTKSQRRVQGPQHVAGVGQQADVGEPVDRCLAIVVHRDHLPGAGHPHPVLHRARDAECDVHVRGDSPSGHPHLARPGHPSPLDKGA